MALYASCVREGQGLLRPEVDDGIQSAIALCGRDLSQLMSESPLVPDAEIYRGLVGLSPLRSTEA
jgi:hypothetical protein